MPAILMMIVLISTGGAIAEWARWAAKKQIRGAWFLLVAIAMVGISFMIILWIGNS